MQVNIKNFMCHEDLNINIDDFQIISADNGSGKSAIFHAINWCINGGSNNFIRTGSKDSSVSIIIDNTEYKREVLKDKYFVYKNEVEICNTKDDFTKLGINIPLEYFSQFDKLYLLNETPKNKADLLNSMFDIESVELASTNIKKDIKDEKLRYEKLVIKNSKDLESLKLLDVKIAELENIENKYNRLKNVLDDIGNIIKLKQKIKDIPDSISLNIDMKDYKSIKNIIDNKSDIKSIPNKIKGSIDYSVFNSIHKTIVLKSRIKQVPETLLFDVDLSDKIEIENILDKIEKLRLDEANVERLEIEHNELDKKLEGVECPLCKKKM